MSVENKGMLVWRYAVDCVGITASQLCSASVTIGAVYILIGLLEDQYQRENQMSKVQVPPNKPNVHSQKVT